MDDVSWQKVREIFDSALLRTPDERQKFVREACGEDNALLAEVESLFLSLDGADRFIETPAIAGVADVIKAEQDKLEGGTRLGHYEIIKQIGSGGMGDVYLAKDTRLNRQVALKLLAAHITEDKNRVSRFRQEAFATSALNHPNIVTIYEIGDWEGRDFIATEFVDGITLRQQLRKKMSVGKALDLAVQVAGGLSAAHGAGIVHRDVKPENIMIRRDGLVKILDFGIAKYLPSENSSRRLVETEVGEVIGTAAYMSPEQARGLEIDQRTDIWSLGVILYEMIAGKLPFPGKTKSDRIAAILEHEPVPLVKIRRKVPPGLEQITNRALAKNKKDRYREAADLAEDLRRLRETTGDERASPFVLPPGRLTVPSRVYLYAASILAVLLMGAIGFGIWFFADVSTNAKPIESIAILPLRSLDAGENYLGLGLADAVIRRISQTGELTVRPTSAVRRYLNDDTDALTAARQLSADAVLEGNVQTTGDRLRVSVNLLRTSNGASLWADNFDMQMSDIFTIQDTVARQVASRLQLQLDSSQQARLMKRSTSNPVAYEFYVKGVYNFDQRGWGNNAKTQMEATIELFKKAIEAEPNFALAHAQLAYAYAWTAIIIEPTTSVWAERAKEEINRAQTLDPQLAETRLARYLLLSSRYENYQNEAAIRELLLAQQFNPNVGRAELGFLYYHIGLEDLSERQYRRALEIDPTSEFARNQSFNQFLMNGKYDESLAAYQKVYPNEPISARYFLGKNRLDEAQRAIEEFSAREPDNPDWPRQQALLFALRGDFRSAESLIPIILSKHPPHDLQYHHAAYDIACLYALEGKSDEAVKWLRETAATGFPSYPLFERDAYLNRIRQTPEFIRFMAEMKAQNESYKQEFE